MDHFQKGILQLITAAVTQTPQPLSDEMDWDEVVLAGRRHKILPLLYYGALQCGAALPPEAKQTMEMETFRRVMVSQNQQYAMEQLFAAFDEAGIDYMPLKGALLLHMYPKAEMRNMGDADVLIRMEQYERIREMLPALGYTERTESDHEFVWYSFALWLELHKRLIPSYNKDYFAYYGDGWQLAKVQKGNRYEMTDEDQMIYLFTHFAKHYRDGGIGLKYMTDLWVYRRCKPDLDEDYIRQELTTLQLYEFYTNVCRTLAVWFEGAADDEYTAFITDFVFCGGEFGRSENKVLAEGVRLSRDGGDAKRRKAVWLVFLPYDNMCQKYPWLKKAPILLPAMWVWRIVTTLLFKGDRVRKGKEKLKKMKADDIQNFHDALRFVGLDFHFEE